MSTRFYAAPSLVPPINSCYRTFLEETMAGDLSTPLLGHCNDRPANLLSKRFVVTNIFDLFR